MPQTLCSIFKYGYIRERAINDPNEFVFDGNICRIKLYNCACEEIAEAIIDADDYDECSNWKWSLTCGRYVLSTDTVNNQQVYIYLHHIILGRKALIDHKNGDTLDNRRYNLRFCTHAENCRNIKIPRHNKSGFKGVSWDKACKKWLACIGYNNKTIRLGNFTDKVQAAIAYNEAAVKYHKDFARLNKV